MRGPISWVKSVLAVPTADTTTNVYERDVVGNKTDISVNKKTTTKSLMAYVKATLDAASYLGNCRPCNGNTYWVDADVGSDVNDGLAIDRPFATLSAAVTAVEAFRVLTTNKHIRCRIMIIGGVTPVPAVVALAQYTDYYGIGASPLGDGVGIARIGTGLTSGAVALTATHRGMYFKNIQFLGASGVDAFLATTLLRSEFEDCVFGDNASSAGAMNSGLKSSAVMGGVKLKNCYLGMANTTYSVYGLYAGSQFTECLVEDCKIAGTTAGIYLHTSINSVASSINRNVIGDFGGGCAKGIDDNSNGLVMITNNVINAADGIEKTTGGNDELVGNICQEGTAGSRVAISEGNLLVRTS